MTVVERFRKSPFQRFPKNVAGTRRDKHLDLLWGCQGMLENPALKLSVLFAF